ncbi:MAG TPA: hypothetical protein VF017_17755 [Thermoanaerobaculia bacterium]|nr:hypothetical protein [Thermoanaerobaculia bacterium]
MKHLLHRAAFAGLALLGCLASTPTHAQNLPFTYVVKYLCSSLEPFPTVFHWTDINLLNPAADQTAEVHKKFVAAGTQDKASALAPVRDRFRLGPNQAASIDCDEIQTQLGLPLSTPLEGFVEIKSNLPLVVVGIYDKCVPRARVDVFMRSTVTTDLRIDGLGEFPRLTLTGPALIDKGKLEIDAARGRFYLPTEIVAMDLEGELRLGGRVIPIRLVESGAFESDGRVVGEIDPLTGAPLFPARASFDVFFEITSTDRGFQEKFGRLYNVEATRVQAAITGLPPGPPSEVVPASVDRRRLERLFPDLEITTNAAGETLLGLRTPAGEELADPVNLYCATAPTPIVSARSPAVPAGELSNHCHSPNPPQPPPPEHVKVRCADASIDVEYVAALPPRRREL